MAVYNLYNFLFLISAFIIYFWFEKGPLIVWSPCIYKNCLYIYNLIKKDLFLSEFAYNSFIISEISLKASLITGSGRYIQQVRKKFLTPKSLVQKAYLIWVFDHFKKSFYNVNLRKYIVKNQWEFLLLLSSRLVF